MTMIEALGQVIADLQCQYEERIEQNRQIQAKIDALENSRRIMCEALGKAEGLRSDVGKQKVDSWWNGSLATEVTDHIEMSHAAANSIAYTIREGIYDIDAHIAGLRAQYDYIAGLISNIEISRDAKMRERQRAIFEARNQRGNRKGA